MASRDHRTRFAQTIDWNLFKNFYEIGRLGGIGAAARALNRQQPSMSIALLRLEHFVGTKLCDRSARGIALTPAGEALFSACQGMNQAVEAAAPPVEPDGPLKGSITVRVISNLHLNPTINAIFREFHARCPAVEIKLDVAVPRLVVEAVQNGEAEIGIGFAAPEAEQVDRIPIYEQVQQLYCGASSRLFRCDKPSFHDLAMEPIVLAKDEPALYVATRARYKLGRQVGGIADNLQERIWLVSLGMGIAFLPRPVVDASAFAASLWPLLPEDEAPVAVVSFFSRCNAANSQAAARLLEVARRFALETVPDVSPAAAASPQAPAAKSQAPAANSDAPAATACPSAVLLAPADMGH